MYKSEDCLLKILNESSSPYVNLKTLQKKCGKNVKSILKVLEEKGEVISKGKRFALPNRVGFIKGIFDGKSGGYGFLMPENESKDLFIAPDDTFTALNGDLVLAKRKKKSRDRWTARIIKVLRRERKYFIGNIVRIEGELMFQPQDKNIPYYFELEGGNKLKENEWVLVEFIKWTTPRLSPLVKFNKRINKTNLINTIINKKFNLNHGFPEIVLDEIKSIKDINKSGRKDLSDLITITIDPEDAKDIDDAISINKRKNRYHLWVHIADVSSHVRKDTPLDKEAKMRGCTTYLPDDTYFMLPHELTKKISLYEGTVSPAITVKMIFDMKGNILEKKFLKAIIKSDKMFNYVDTQDIIDGRMSSEFSEELKIMSEFAEILSRKRDREGYLDFYRQEVEVKIHNSEPVEIIPRKDLWTNEIIEQFMIAANEAVAERIYENKIPSIYRIHEEPDNRQLNDYKNMVKSLGLNLKSINRDDLSIFLNDIKNSPYERILNYELLRCMKRARYIAQAEPHYGLASELYTHFTSPIRRYPDLVIQRILFGEKYSKDELKEIADHSTEQEWKADEAEREITNYYILKFLEKNQWKEHRGMIVNLDSNGIWIELDEFLISGYLPINNLPPDNYKLKGLLLKGKKHNYKVGDLLLVKIYSVSPEIGELQLDYSGFIKK